MPRNLLGRDQLNPYLYGARGKEVEQRNLVPITMGGFTRVQFIEVIQMLDLDATPNEGVIFHCAGQGSGESRVFDPWDLHGAFDQFLRRAARLIAEGLNNFSDPESLAGKLAFAPGPEGSTCPVVVQRISRCSPNAPECAYYLAAMLRNENTVGPSAKAQGRTSPV